MKTLAGKAEQQELRDRMVRLAPDLQARWGRMSCHGMVCHLADAFVAVRENRAVTPLRLPLPGPVIRFFALRVPLRWRPGVPTVPELEQGVGGTPPKDFEADRARLAQAFAAFLEVPPSELPRTHPIFGPMTAWHWGRWAYLHTDHHLRQFGR